MASTTRPNSRAISGSEGRDNCRSASSRITVALEKEKPVKPDRPGERWQKWEGQPVTDVDAEFGCHDRDQCPDVASGFPVALDWRSNCVGFTFVHLFA
jgi:hypothetical protein